MVDTRINAGNPREGRRNSTRIEDRDEKKEKLADDLKLIQKIFLGGANSKC